MSGLVGNPFLLASAAGGATGYQIERSLRFNSSDSAFCGRSFSSAGNRTTWSLSFWYKRSTLGTNQCLFVASDFATTTTTAYVTSSDTIEFYDYQSSAYSTRLITSQVFRDTSAWYHLVFAWDTNNSTSADRVRIYVNGSRVSTFTTSTYPSSGTQSRWNNNVAHEIGKENTSNYLNGYLADVIFVDGQALTPSSFTEVSATTGQLIPKAYTGSFGTNGFWLKFSDNSAATATTLGKDYSGNSNNWTPNNLSVTAGAGNDSLTDTPTSGGTDTGLGGQVTGNYATFNPFRGTGSVGGLSNGNLDVIASASGQDYRPISTIGVSSGKWYWEVTKTCAASNSIDFIVGIANAADTGATYSSGSQRTDPIDTVYGVSIDFDTLTFAIKKNNVALYSTSIVANTYFAYVNVFFFGVAASATINFGQRPFAYTAPSGFKALCDTNLPAPVVAKPSTVMDVKLYTGNGTTQTISGLGFSPDFVWIKARSNSGYQHVLQDIVRGAGKSLFSSLTSQEIGNAGDLVGAFNSDGFSVNNNYNGGTAPETNGSSSTYVAWTWDAGTSTVTNTQGSITSTVRANPSAGFSVCTYTGSSSNFTFGHGLNVEPRLILIKNRSASANWFVLTKASGSWQYGFLNTTDALANAAQSANSTVVDLNNASWNWYNANGNNFVAYVFSPVAGYSSMSSFVGNGSSDGPFQWCGFRPRWILLKNATTGGANYDWFIWDTARSSFNTARETLFANLSNAEAPTYITGIDVLSNGFKLRDGSAAWNGNGNTIVWAAFAESPFAYSRAR